MEATKSELLVPFIRSCRKETPTPVHGTVTGNVPEWLQGTLIRVGSGLLDVGPNHFAHVFDGMALMHKFSMHNGQVTYQNRFLRSDAYTKNMQANGIVITEFGTAATVPDPCKTAFQRFSSFFSEQEFTDNDLVNIIKYTDEFYATTETSLIWKVDPETLESLKKVDLKQYVPVKTGTAHAHEGPDGTVYNVGLSAGRPTAYAIMQFPPKTESQDGAFDRGKVVATIPATRRSAPCYFHSFGMSENYFVFVEQPLFISGPKMLLRRFTSTTFADCLQWQPEHKARFFIVRRQDGELLQTQYFADAFMTFHHINAYEDNDHLVVDICCYDNGDIIKALYRKALEDIANDLAHFPPGFKTSARRFVLPLKTKGNQDENLVQLPKSTAQAFPQSDGSVLCIPENLHDEDWNPELPRIHYEKFNTHKYRYFYAMARCQKFDKVQIIKVDTENKTTVVWEEEGTSPSEPVFVADPGSKEGDEDDGILMFSLLFYNDDQKVAIVLLNAKTMKEFGRAEFKTESSVPADFHGIFIPKAS